MKTYGKQVCFLLVLSLLICSDRNVDEGVYCFRRK